MPATVSVWSVSADAAVVYVVLGFEWSKYNPTWVVPHVVRIVKSVHQTVRVEVIIAATVIIIFSSRPR